MNQCIKPGWMVCIAIVLATLEAEGGGSLEPKNLGL